MPQQMQALQVLLRVPHKIIADTSNTHLPIGHIVSVMEF